MIYGYMIYTTLIIIFLFFILFYIIKASSKIENFDCKTPKYDRQGGLNDKKVLLNYKPQSNIKTQPCEDYWYKEPLEYNNTQVQQSPVVIWQNQLVLPPDKQWADNNYKKGLIDYNKIIKLINDDDKVLGVLGEEDSGKTILDRSKPLYIDPQTKQYLKFRYELEFTYDVLNNKTYINRWQVYNPSVEEKFNYDDIKSPIEDINILNLEFKNRFDLRQKYTLNDSQLINYGIMPYQIFKYKILDILYLDGDANKPVYVIEISFFRETDLYINTFSYVGMVEKDRIIITDAKYIGVNATDETLLAQAYNPNEITNEIINPNFSNKETMTKDPDAIVAITKKEIDSFKLKNQWACFNLNTTENVILLPYFSRETCESQFDFFGRSKNVGIYDKPCKENTDCPFYKANKNYENEFGKCMPDGYCELPINMKPIGYRYFVSDEQSEPLCYNCDSKEFENTTLIDKCCGDQYDKKKYPFLKSPDYTFEKDELVRKNYFNSLNCVQKINGDNPYNISCK